MPDKIRESLISVMQEWGNEHNDSFPFESVADYLLKHFDFIKERTDPQ